MYIDLNQITIKLDSSVKRISKVACYHLSGILENGIVLANNERPTIAISKNQISFGRCMNPELSGFTGNIMFRFFLEYGEIIYHFPDSLKYSFLTKSIDYDGAFAPDKPDNIQLFNLIYPRFA